MIRSPSLLALLALQLLARSASAQGTDPRAGRDGELLRLGEHFYAGAQYYRSVGAFEELRLLSQDDRLRRHAGLRIAMAYHRGLQVDQAVRAYDELLAELAPADPRAGYVRLLRVLARAEGSWRGVREVPPLDLVTDLEPLAGHEGAPYRTLSGYHTARFWLAAGQRQAATAALARTDGHCRARPDPHCAQLDRLRAALALPGPRRRSPWLGGGLSAVIPGLGSLYDGAPVDALYYFALTTGPALMAWDIHERGRGFGDQRASFYVLGSMAALFYVSAITQGALGAVRFNQVQRVEHRRAVLRTTETPLPLDPAGFLPEAQ